MTDKDVGHLQVAVIGHLQNVAQQHRRRLTPWGVGAIDPALTMLGQRPYFALVSVDLGIQLHQKSFGGWASPEPA